MRSSGDARLASPAPGSPGSGPGARRAAARIAGRGLPALLGLLLLGAPVAAGGDPCLGCHQGLQGKPAAPAAASGHDVHAKLNLGCADCHGLGKHPPAGQGKGGDDCPRSPPPKDVPALCARCHEDAAYMKRFRPTLRVDQLAEYQTSVHGVKLAEGDTKVATCTSCHGAHGIRQASDPLSPVSALKVVDTCARCHADPDYMKEYGLPTDQVATYRKSVHGEALYVKGDTSAPKCNDCHGNHGAVPPGVSSVANVCGRCHDQEAEFFRASTKGEIFRRLGIPECASCHGNHAVRRTSVAMLGSGEGSVCTSCHEAGEEPLRFGDRLRGGLDALSARIQEAEEVLGHAKRAGMEVGKPIYELEEARSRFVRARVLVHGFSEEILSTPLAEGIKIAEAGRAAGQRALEERDFRRKGLAVSLVFIVFLMVLLALKIREVDRRHGAPAEPAGARAGEAGPER